jgi:hypothetical protein
MTGKSYKKPEGERVKINQLVFVWRIHFYYDTLSFGSIFNIPKQDSELCKVLTV